MAKGKKKLKKLSTEELFTLAEEYLEGDQTVKTGNKKKNDAKVAVIEELQRRKVKVMESSSHGLRVTLTQVEHMVIDADALYTDLKPAQRPKAYDRSIDLSVLSPERRQELIAIMHSKLTQAELRACTVNSLNEERLSQAVQDDKIPAALVAAHTEIKPNAPFIRVTRSGKES